LTHVRVEVVEVTQLLRPVARIGVRWIVPLVMLNVNKDIVLLRCCKKFLVVFQQLHCGLCDEDVYSALDCIEGDGVVCGVGCEDGD